MIPRKGKHFQKEVRISEFNLRNENKQKGDLKFKYKMKKEKQNKYCQKENESNYASAKTTLEKSSRD